MPADEPSTGDLKRIIICSSLSGPYRKNDFIVISKTELHRESMKDDYDKIAQNALEEKKNAVLETRFQKEHFYFQY